MSTNNAEQGNKVKLVIAESNQEEQRRLEEMFRGNDEFEIAGIADDGETALQLATEHSTGVLLCTLALKNADGLTLTERLKSRGADTKVMMLSSAFSDHCIKRMVDCGVDYYMLRPFEPEYLMKQILSLVGGQKASDTNAARALEQFATTKKMDERISNIFITVGIPAHIKGYQFLREAVRLTIDKPDIINSITKQLYPSIARRFSTTASKVERAIRHAIEVGWARGKIENINNIFGVKVYGQNDKPTNGEFIALVADKMLLEGVNVV